jgi:hypothetical protein
MAVPNTFASATSAIPLANLDANFTYYDTAYSITGTTVAFSGNITVTGTSTLTGVATLTANPVLSAGTANGVTYLNGSKSLTSGTGLVFDGTNLGIGVTPNTWSSGKVLEIGNSGSALWGNSPANVYITENAYYNGGWKYGATAGAATYQLNQNSHVWSIAPLGTAGNAITFTQAMTLDASGNLLVGTTSALATTTHSFVASGASNGAPMASRNQGATSGKYWTFGPDTSNNYRVFNNGGTGMYMVDGATAWTATSDERKKDIIEPIVDATNKVSSLRAVIGKYKTDENGIRRSFLIAQDVQAVFPEAVNASNPDELGVQYTDVIPLLVAAIQEQQALITALTARIETLENK